MAPPVLRWLNLVMLGGDAWILPIWSAANDAAKAGKLPPLPNKLGQLGLYISMRLDLLPRIGRRITQETSEVLEIARRHEPKHIFTPTAKGYAFPVDDDLKFRLIVDINALLFEVNACWELMRRLFQLVRVHVGHPIGQKEVTDELRAVLHATSHEWFAWLDRQRNFVAHKGTLYLAIDLTNDAFRELLVTKEQPTTFADPKTFFRYSELVELVRGFDVAKQALKTHLIELFSGKAIA